MSQKFAVGDTVRIKTWESMAAEYGISPVGDILVSCLFTTAMKYLCGTEHIIQCISRDGVVEFEDTTDCWTIHVDMLEKTEPLPDINLGDYYRIIDYCGGDFLMK